MDAVRIDQLDTPCLTVDLDVFESNLRLCLDRLVAVRVRPHLKTAKSPEVARLLLSAGAVGICVAKLSEAEVMLAAGIDDVLITTELAGAIKARRLARLIDRWPDACVSVVVDSWEGASELNAALPRPLDTLIEVNVGQDRCGVAPEGALALADRIRELERLRLVGLQGYEGNLQHVRDPGERQTLSNASMRRLAVAVQDLRAAGHMVNVVSTGGTGTAEFCARHEAVTEVQPGSFMFGRRLPRHPRRSLPAGARRDRDRDQPTDPGPRGDDAGLKTPSDDSGPARLADTTGWTYQPAGDEHGTLTPDGGPQRRVLRVGDRVGLLPSHIDTTVNLHDALHAHRSGQIETTWVVAARGKLQ